MKSYALLILASTAVACAASRDDLPVQPPDEPHDIWQDGVLTSISLLLWMSPEGRGYEKSTSKIWSCNADGDSFIIEPRVQYKRAQV